MEFLIQLKIFQFFASVQHLFHLHLEE